MKRSRLDTVKQYEKPLSTVLSVYVEVTCLLDDMSRDFSSLPVALGESHQAAISTGRAVPK